MYRSRQRLLPFESPKPNNKNVTQAPKRIKGHLDAPANAQALSICRSSCQCDRLPANTRSCVVLEVSWEVRSRPSFSVKFRDNDLAIDFAARVLMWRFVSSGDSGGHPLLETVNGFAGRQYWQYDPTGGTPEEREEVERLRATFTANRLRKRDSDDAFIRLRARQRILRARIEVPKDSLPEGVPVLKKRIAANLTAAVRFYECLQEQDGHWPGDYGGPMFLLPGLIITAYVTKTLDTVFPAEGKIEVMRYLKNHQNEDGGFGLHIEGRSSMFGTSLKLLTLPSVECERVVGQLYWNEDHGHGGRRRGGRFSQGLGRAFRQIDSRAVVTATVVQIQKNEGAVYATSWAKFWMCVLGVYKWEGINPLTPEMWLLPYSKLSLVGIMHPGRFWCHCRMVYLPMSYVYGMRHKLEVEADPLVQALREELYVVPYESIDWNSCRNKVADVDSYYPHPWIQNVVWWALYQVEPVLKDSTLRDWATKEAMKHIHYEDENTRYIDIGPVNKALNMLACYIENPDSQAFKKHLARVPDYLWVAEDGMKMQGYNGSQLWDTSFSIQAICSVNQHSEFKETLRKAHQYLHNTQVRTEAAAPLDAYYRHVSLGAWPFSSQDHGWPISDCTAEALKAALLLRQLPEEDVGAPIPVGWIFQAVNVVLSYQNADGGMATYEQSRSYPFIEAFNPSETFGDIIIDYSCVECTSACMQALKSFSVQFPEHRAQEIQTALEKARGFVLGVQQQDGSWYGSWGVCFTYGTWFGLSALEAMGEFYENSEPVQRACNFLVERQRSDGGWGESYLSCQNKVYNELEGTSHVVNTAWAMIGLIRAKYHFVDSNPLHRGAKFLLGMQTADGDWPQQHISGVFNRNCMITYTNYRYIFPTWALGMYCEHVLDDST